MKKQLSFKHVLSKVRSQTESLRDVNQNLQKEINERHKIEEALRRSEAQLQSLWTDIPIGLHRRTLDGKLISANPKFVSIFGYTSEEEVLQVSIPQLYYEPEDYRELMNRLEVSSTIQAHESRFRCKDGRIIWCVLDMKMVRDQETGMLCINGALQDITYRKHLEIDKQNLGIQLRQAQKMEVTGTLAGGIAHDFNNILSAIIGFCELAADDADEGSVQQDNLKEALVAAKRASDLVKQIQTFARQSEVEKRPAQVDDEIRFQKKRRLSWE
jgi:PAS domain S-box-containing protein